LKKRKDIGRREKEEERLVQTLLQMTLPQIKNTKTQGNTASYEIEPLEAGYGMTLGNALRRVLLSSLAGAAVTSLRIEGVTDETQILPGVTEDVTDLVLNIKRLRFRSLSEHPVSLQLKVSGAREVTGADIIAPGNIEIINPELHIANLENDDAHLNITLVVETGRGYVSATAEDNQAAGEFFVDAIFTPVQNVIYTVEHTRVGQMTNFEKIVLELTTDGTMVPDEALRQGAEILVRHFSLLSNSQEQLPEKETIALSHISQEMQETPIEELGLSVRTYNSLRRNNLLTVGQVLMLNEEELSQIRNFGEKSKIELLEKLREAHYLPAAPEASVADSTGE
jgi:DNA-directed RNA polymerase subunit alpha